MIFRETGIARSRSPAGHELSRCSDLASVGGPAATTFHHATEVARDPAVLIGTIDAVPLVTFTKGRSLAHAELGVGFKHAFRHAVRTRLRSDVERPIHDFDLVANLETRLVAGRRRLPVVLG